MFTWQAVLTMATKSCIFPGLHHHGQLRFKLLQLGLSFLPPDHNDDPVGLVGQVIVVLDSILSSLVNVMD